MNAHDHQVTTAERYQIKNVLHQGFGRKKNPGTHAHPEYKKYSDLVEPPHPSQVNFHWRPTALSLLEVQTAIDKGIFNPNDVKLDAHTAFTAGLLRDPSDCHTAMRYELFEWPGLSLISVGHRYFRSAVHFEVGDVTRRAIGFVEANGGKVAMRYHSAAFFEGPSKHPFYLTYYLGAGLKPHPPVTGTPFQLAHWSLWARADKRGYLSGAARETLYEADHDSRGPGADAAPATGAFVDVDHPLTQRGPVQQTSAYAKHLAQLALRDESDRGFTAMSV